MEINNQPQTAPIAKDAKRNNSAAKLALVLTTGALLLEPTIAMAAPWDQAVRAISDTLTGTLGRTIAIIAVVVLGFMAMAGKLEWMNAIKVVVGIVIVFSAAQIINWISPNTGLVVTIPANSQAECNARNYVWVPAGVEIADNLGVIIPAEPPKCVEPQYAMSACTSTVNAEVAAAAGVAGARPTATYFTYAAGALNCS